MNQELITRLIGAIVVTALAAIFVPMAFEEPVDNTSQTVSELEIPKEPAIATETAEKLPDLSVDAPSEMGIPDDKLGEGTVSPDEPSVEAAESVKREDVDANPEEKPQDFTDEEEPATPVVGKLRDKVSEGAVHANKKPEAHTNPVKKLKESPADGHEKAEKSPNAARSRWFIQAGSFSKKENASVMVEKLRKQGMPVVLDTIKVAGKGTLYRVKVGPSLDKTRASSMKAKLDQQNIKSNLVAE
jgi:DedD protein